MGRRQFNIYVKLFEFDILEFFNLLHRAERIGFIFAKILNDLEDHSFTYFFNVNEIYEKIKQGNSSIKDIGESIKVKYQDTWLSIHFFQHKKIRSFSITWDTETSGWEKAFPIEPGWDDEDPFIMMRDNARHARLLLDLVDPFLISGFKIHDDDMIFYLPELPCNSLAASLYMDLVKDDIAWMLTNNIFFNKCIVYESFALEIAYSRDEFKELLYNQLVLAQPFEFCVQRDGYYINVKIAMRQILITPLAPMKKKIYQDDEGIDIGFYLRLLISFCDDFIIEELKTNFVS